MQFNAFVLLIDSSIYQQNLVFVYNHNKCCFCIILLSTLTVCNFLVFLVFIFNFLNKTLEVDNIDNVLHKTIVSHYGWTKMQDIRMYSSSEVPECKITPGSLYIAPPTIILYQETSRTKLTATMWFVKIHVFRYNCGFSLLHFTCMSKKASLVT